MEYKYALVALIVTNLITYHRSRSSSTNRTSQQKADAADHVTCDTSVQQRTRRNASNPYDATYQANKPNGPPAFGSFSTVLDADTGLLQAITGSISSISTCTSLHYVDGLAFQAMACCANFKQAVHYVHAPKCK
eukprot:6210747-Pleurochrysis_carterae.AAC.2